MTQKVNIASGLQIESNQYQQSSDRIEVEDDYAQPVTEHISVDADVQDDRQHNIILETSQEQAAASFDCNTNHFPILDTYKLDSSQDNKELELIAADDHRVEDD